jgi:hypothetical protein
VAVAAEKLSISFDADLADEVRTAAADEGVSVSTWLAEAAAAKARQNHLRSALEAYARDEGELTDDEVDRLIAGARERSLITRPGAA